MAGSPGHDRRFRDFWGGILATGKARKNEHMKYFIVFRVLLTSRFPRRLSENGYFSQSLRQAEIIILEILHCIPVVIISAFLDLEKNISFSDSLPGSEPFSKTDLDYRCTAVPP